MLRGILTREGSQELPLMYIHERFRAIEREGSRNRGSRPPLEKANAINALAHYFATEPITSLYTMARRAMITPNLYAALIVRCSRGKAVRQYRNSYAQVTPYPTILIQVQRPVIACPASCHGLSSIPS